MAFVKLVMMLTVFQITDWLIQIHLDHKAIVCSRAKKIDRSCENLKSVSLSILIIILLKKLSNFLFILFAKLVITLMKIGVLPESF